MNRAVCSDVTWIDCFGSKDVCCSMTQLDGRVHMHALLFYFILFILQPSERRTRVFLLCSSGKLFWTLVRLVTSEFLPFTQPSMWQPDRCCVLVKDRSICGCTLRTYTGLASWRRYRVRFAGASVNLLMWGDSLHWFLNQIDWRVVQKLLKYYWSIACRFTVTSRQNAP